MNSHPLFTCIAAVLLSFALATIDRRDARERLYVGVRTFLCCVTSVVAGGWLMRWIHG